MLYYGVSYSGKSLTVILCVLIVIVNLFFFSFRLSTQVLKIPNHFQHMICLATGVVSLHIFFSTTVYYIISLVIMSYILLLTATYFQFERHRGALLILTSLSFLVICELWLVDAKEWHRIRGPQMIIVMKSVSLGFDLDIGTIEKIPNLVQYSGL